MSSTILYTGIVPHMCPDGCISATQNAGSYSDGGILGPTPCLPRSRSCSGVRLPHAGRGHPDASILPQSQRTAHMLPFRQVRVHDILHKGWPEKAYPGQTITTRWLSACSSTHVPSACTALSFLPMPIETECRTSVPSSAVPGLVPTTCVRHPRKYSHGEAFLG